MLRSMSTRARYPVQSGGTAAPHGGRPSFASPRPRGERKEGGGKSPPAPSHLFSRLSARQHLHHKEAAGTDPARTEADMARTEADTDRTAGSRSPRTWRSQSPR